MKLRMKYKLMIDLIMTLLFVVMMGVHHTGMLLHEWLGVSLFLLFIFHSTWNWRWYCSLFHSPYPRQKCILMVINLTLFIWMCFAMVSGILMSKEVFGFLQLSTNMFARRIHMISTAWCFVCMSIHFGYHWLMIYMNVKRNKSFPTSKPMIHKCILMAGAVFAIFGVAIFIQREFWNELFLLVDFVFLDYQESFGVFLCKQITMMISFGWIGVLLRKWK